MLGSLWEPVVERIMFTNSVALQKLLNFGGEVGVEVGAPFSLL